MVNGINSRSKGVKKNSKGFNPFSASNGKTNGKSILMGNGKKMARAKRNQSITDTFGIQPESLVGIISRGI